MAKTVFKLTIFISLLACTTLSAHDLFIKLEQYALQPGAPVTIPVLNGTFAASEGSVAPDRLADLSLLSPAGRQHLDKRHWAVADDTSYIKVQPEHLGIHVVGVSTKAREITLSGAQFNEYLAHDGIPDILAARKNADPSKDVLEVYEKHVKAVFQVGGEVAGPFDGVMGYPAEIVLLNNPYVMAVGDEIRVRCLVGGRPAGNQFILAGGEQQGIAFEEMSARTDANGEAGFRLDRAGKWYLRFIHMTPSGEEGIDYRSKWATITFELH